MSKAPHDALAELRREAEALATYIADNSDVCEADAECNTPACVDFPGDLQERIMQALKMAYDLGREDGR